MKRGGAGGGGRRAMCWAARWQEAYEAGYAPHVVLEATHEGALRYCRLEDLQAHAIGAAG